MKYSTPVVRDLGTLTSLTLGQNGSSPDGGVYVNQNGHGVDSASQKGTGNPNGTGHG